MNFTNRESSASMRISKLRFFYWKYVRRGIKCGVNARDKVRVMNA